MASIAPSSSTLTHALSSSSSRYQQVLLFTPCPSLKTQKAIFPRLFLKSRERNLIKWVDGDSKSHLLAAVAAEAEVAEIDGESESEAAIVAPQSKPKKGKAALPLKRDRVLFSLSFLLFFFALIIVCELILRLPVFVLKKLN